MDIAVRTATPEDLDSLLVVLDEAGAWLQSIGVRDQWPVSFSADPSLVQLAQNFVVREEMFVACDGIIVAGCFRLEFEGAGWPSDVPAAYLSSLAVARRYAGMGVAHRMLDWAAEHTADLGRTELRLDCWAGNQRLRNYYLGAGFEWRGDIQVVSRGDNPAVPEENRDKPYFVSLFARRVTEE